MTRSKRHGEVDRYKLLIKESELGTPLPKVEWPKETDVVTAHNAIATLLLAAFHWADRKLDVGVFATGEAKPWVAGLLEASNFIINGCGLPRDHPAFGDYDKHQSRLWMKACGIEEIPNLPPLPSSWEEYAWSSEIESTTDDDAWMDVEEDEVDWDE